MKKTIQLSLLAAAACVFPCSLAAQSPWYPGQSVVWQNAQSPYTPGEGAIAGGPGASPDPGSPMYICRAMYQGSMTPGKWVKGNCNISYGGREYVMNSYQVAYGNAYWRRYRGNAYGLVQTGTEADGAPIYSCRVHYIVPSANAPNMNVPNMPSMPTPPNVPNMNVPNMPSAPSVPNIPNIPNMPNMNISNLQGSGPSNMNSATDYGFQPGKIVDGNCDFPFAGQEIVQPRPFEALFAGGGGYPPYPQPYPYPYPPPSPPSGPSYPTPGPSSVTWQQERAPFTPAGGAIMGGPGDGPQPGSPLYVCRAGYNGALLPGKWIQGKCSISADGREIKVNTYDVAYGSGRWAPFGGLDSALVPGGYDANQNPVYICRVPHFNFWTKDRGYQPGSLIGNQCIVSYGGTALPNDAPFEALYSTADEGSEAPPQQPTQSGGIQVLFQSGTSSTPGKITIMNGATGQTITEALAPNLDQAGCVSILQKAAFEAGLQIQAQQGGLRIFGSNNSVNVSGAAVSVTQF